LQDIIKGWYDFEAAIGKFYARMSQVSSFNFAANIILQFTSIATALSSIYRVIRAVVINHSR
jgi:hypothetical protein